MAARHVPAGGDEQRWRHAAQIDCRFIQNPAYMPGRPLDSKASSSPCGEGALFLCRILPGRAIPPAAKSGPLQLGRAPAAAIPADALPPAQALFPPPPPAVPRGTNRHPPSQNRAVPLKDGIHPWFPPLGNSLPGAKIRHSCIILVLAGHPSSISIQQRRMRDACCFL